MALSSDLAGVFQLILAQQQAEERKEARQEQTALTLLNMEMKEKTIDLAASRELYNENQKLYYNALENLQTLESNYGETVGSLEPLNEMYKASGKEVAVGIYEGEATDYQARADQALDNWQAVQNKISTLQGSLYGDVKRAKNIIAGGFGFRGGTMPKEWDAGDLGLIAYEIQYGEASPTVQSLFKNNIGAVNESLLKLRKTEQTFELTEKKMDYYEDKTAADKVKSENNKAELIFGTLSNTSKKMSGMQNLQALQIAAANFDINTVSADRVANEQAQFTIYKTIGKEFSKLIGRDVEPGDYPAITEEYIEMQNLGVGDAASLMGQTAYGNWTAFKGYLDDAAKEYVAAVQSGDSEKARILNELAGKYFGMPPGISLTQFAADIGMQYSKTILATFGKSGLIDSSEMLPGIIDAPEMNPAIQDKLITIDQEWEELLNE